MRIYANLQENIRNPLVASWIKEQAELLCPHQIVVLRGSAEEFENLCSELCHTGAFTKLNPALYPGSYWYSSDPLDVARVEERTFICCGSREDAGPLNNWMRPGDAYQQLRPLLQGAMRSRTMYVIPYLMGPSGSSFSKVGYEITDSPYVAASMCCMTRVGDVAQEHLGPASADFVKGVHSMGTMNPQERYICHFPETRTIISVNTNYGGNALQGKKCFALRIASCQARAEGWLAEHMLILGITNPRGAKHYICAAFPSACGKTNLAMLVPPRQYAAQGWKIETVGDDIAWLRIGADGGLWAVNPEAGFFGVAPGTNEKTNPNALATIQRNTIFTNTALDTTNMTPWWEGLSEAPQKLLDWRRQPWQSGNGPAAHPNARFTVSAAQCPTIDTKWDSPEGVPISAIIFGGRRAKTAPLVYEAFDWIHGVYVGASLCSETTAAAAGKVGELRLDPMAMRPFIGYHVGDYLGHWCNFGRLTAKLPKIFHVNWFRKDESGKFLWPGYGENLRVLEWIIGRVEGSRAARATPVGLMPSLAEFNFAGLELPGGAAEKLFHIDPAEWIGDLESQHAFFTQVGPKLPPQIWAEHEALRERMRLAEIGEYA